MSVSPRRRADRAAPNRFVPVATSDFADALDTRKRALRPAADQPRGLSVSDRLRLFEQMDQSVRERTSPDVLRKSPFKGALEAFGGAVPLDLETDSSKSGTSSDPDPVPYSPRGPMPQMKTKIGNRDVTPILTAPKAPPLVGLPIPPAQGNSPTENSDSLPFRSLRRSRMSMRSGKSQVLDDADGEHKPAPQEKGTVTQTESSSSQDTFDDPDVSTSEHDTHYMSYEELPAVPAPDPAAQPTILESQQSTRSSPPMRLDDPELMPRFSYRHSVRLPRTPTSGTGDENPAKFSFRHSRRIAPDDATRLSFLPESTSFLDFDEDERLAGLGDDTTTEGRSEATSKGPSGWTDMSFDEPDTFETFGAPSKDLKLAVDLKEDLPEGEGPRPGSNESEKPAFPMMSFTKKKANQSLDDDEDGTLDVPNRFTRRPGAEGALRELQRASVTAGNEIAASLRLMGNCERSTQPVEEATTREGKVSKVQGDLLLRSRIFRRWNLRYASIIQQGYFGSVLLLFRSDSKGGVGGVFALKSSKMIALAEASARRVDNTRRGGNTFMFELKTSQRTYMFACNDEEGREFWLKNLSSSGA